jgi:hypothetical protein
MSFDTTAGTRGGRQPGGFVFRWGNKLMAGRVRKGRAKFLGFNALVLTTVGRKTGIERTTPVGWFPGPDGRKVPVTAEQLHDAEREQAWQQVITAAPRFVQYQVKTDRELPIIRLTPRSGGEAPPE